MKGNTGYVKPSNLGNLLARAYNDFKYCTGVMFWQYYSDQKRTAFLIATYQLENILERNPKTNK